MREITIPRETVERRSIRYLLGEFFCLEREKFDELDKFEKYCILLEGDFLKSPQDSMTKIFRENYEKVVVPMYNERKIAQIKQNFPHVN